MRSPSDIIIELESDNSRLFKEDVIRKEMLSGNEVFFSGIGFACNKLITFGVKQIPEKNDDSNDTSVSWDQFVVLLNKLINREVTGNDAKNAIIQTMELCSKKDWNFWFRRILLKDLKCGVSEKTVNNVVLKQNPKYSIPVFSCQLAQDSNNHHSKLFGEKIVEVKLDGVRVISVVYPNGTVNQFSRNGKELLNFDNIKKQLSKFAHKFEYPVVLDGEVMSSSFQDLMKQVYRKTDVCTNDAVLYLFDIVPLSDFENGYSKIPQKDRSDILAKWYSVSEIDNVNVVNQELIDLNTSEGSEKLKQINKAAIDGGYEGIMIKDPNAPYECKRTSSWLKLKPILTFDLTITDLQEGRDKYSGMVGALVCSGEEDGKTINVDVGSGLTDEQRISFWENKRHLIGRIVEIKCDTITQNQNGTYSLRFPVFMRLRGFESGEKF